MLLFFFLLNLRTKAAIGKEKEGKKKVVRPMNATNRFLRFVWCGDIAFFPPLFCDSVGVLDLFFVPNQLLLFCYLVLLLFLFSFFVLTFGFGVYW